MRRATAARHAPPPKKKRKKKKKKQRVRSGDRQFVFELLFILVSCPPPPRDVGAALAQGGSGRVAGSSRGDQQGCGQEATGDARHVARFSALLYADRQQAWPMKRRVRLLRGLPCRTKLCVGVCGEPTKWDNKKKNSRGIQVRRLLKSRMPQNRYSTR